MQPSDEIKQKLDIVDLIREYIPLKPAGMNFRANCPFHQEKSPSFIVSPDKQIWHCFGCGKGGDLFSFVQEMEGVEFVEALRILAPKAGVVLKRQDPKAASQRNRLLDILDLSRQFYYRVLMEAKEAASAREYLAQRGLSEETIEEWQIGYSIDKWDTILKRLKEKGFTDKEIFLSGMSVKSTGSSRFYDRFRGRIMFPIMDVNSNTVAFSARVSPEKEAEEKMGKYINSPQSTIYDKSKIIFGLDKAKFEAKARDMIVIVEGQMDVVTAHQHGFKNVVASSGTALTSDQIAIIKRYTANIYLAFDMDEAGSLAADRGIQIAMQAEMNIKVVELPEGKDPDDCIRKDPSAWEKAVAEAKPMMQYYFDKTFAPLDMNNTDERRQAAKVLLPIIAKLGNLIERDIWVRKLSEKIDVQEQVLRESLSRGLANERPRKGDPARAKPSERLSKSEQLSELVLAVVIRFPSLLEYAGSRLEINHLAGKTRRNIYKNLIFYYNNVINESNELLAKFENNEFDYSHFRNWINDISRSETKNNIDVMASLDADQPGLFDRLVLLGDKEFYEKDFSQAKNEAIGYIVSLKKIYLSSRMKEIIELIAKSEQEGRAEEAGKLTGELKLLSDEMRDLTK